MFKPVFQITPSIAKALMSIEADRRAVDDLPIDVEMLNSLRETARVVATHYSTQIEGNRLTQTQVKQAIARVHFPGRERDELEVRCYYLAQDEVERLARKPGSITQQDIRRIHGLIMTGKPKATPYRDGQNVIRNSGSGGIVYLPPETRDVAMLMSDLLEWIKAALRDRQLPLPLIAGLGHYQFATIHPFYDGNGRTARLLTTLILHKSGYGLKGIYSLDEYYAKNLAGYYDALAVGPSHNYYVGRAEADLTGFLTYFCLGMADAFSKVRLQAVKAGNREAKDRSRLLSQIGLRERKLLTLLKKRQVVTSIQIGRHLGLTTRTTVALCRKWLADGFLQTHDASRKNRSYRIGRKFEQMIE